MLKHALAMLAFLALPCAALAQTNAQGLAEKYTPLAGSEAGARSLVTGLREGTEITLGKTKYTPPTGKMGNGNVDIALRLTEASLQEKGIAKPTPDQLKSALDGVLQQRADGKGWGQIAQSMNLKLGDVMRSDKAQRPERVARAEKPEKPQRVERAERPERPEKPERPHK